MQEVARYTRETWGEAQTARYAARLEAHLRALASGRGRARLFLRHRPELRVSRCGHHYVFHLVRDNQGPLILAVFHERMDLMQRLRDRLS